MFSVRLGRETVGLKPITKGRISSHVHTAFSSAPLTKVGREHKGKKERDRDTEQMKGMSKEIEEGGDGGLVEERWTEGH